MRTTDADGESVESGEQQLRSELALKYGSHPAAYVPYAGSGMLLLPRQRIKKFSMKFRTLAAALLAGVISLASVCEAGTPSDGSLDAFIKSLPLRKTARPGDSMSKAEFVQAAPGDYDQNVQRGFASAGILDLHSRSFADRIWPLPAYSNYATDIAELGQLQKAFSTWCADRASRPSPGNLPQGEDALIAEITEVTSGFAIPDSRVMVCTGPDGRSMAGAYVALNGMNIAFYDAAAAANLHRMVALRHAQ